MKLCPKKKRILRFNISLRLNEFSSMTKVCVDYFPFFFLNYVNCDINNHYNNNNNNNINNNNHYLNETIDST